MEIVFCVPVHASWPCPLKSLLTLSCLGAGSCTSTLREKVISRPHLRLFYRTQAQRGAGWKRIRLGHVYPSSRLCAGYERNGCPTSGLPFAAQCPWRLFSAAVAPHGRLFDHENRMITKEIMFMARFYLRLDQLPDNHSASDQ